jgi:hypothetical protein
MSVDELRDLLDVCPPLDPKTDLTAGNMLEEGQEPPRDPRIGFDLPEGDARRELLEAVVTDHIERMYEDARR